MKQHLPLLAGLSTTIVLCAFLTNVFGSAGQDLVRLSGVQGGLCVHLGCGNGSITADLDNDGKILVQGLALDENSLQASRDAIFAARKYGQISAVLLRGPQLPYATNSANLLVVDLPVSGMTDDELWRVVCPGGVIARKQGASWGISTKPWPSSMDQWPMGRHDPERTGQSKDVTVGPPQVLQFEAGPQFFNTPILSVDGLLLAIDARQDSWWMRHGKLNTVYCRDAFNGLLRWQKTLKFYAGDQIRNGWSTGDFPGTRYINCIAGANKRFYFAGDSGVTALSSFDGQVVAKYPTPGGVNSITIAGRLLIASTKAMLIGFDLTTDREVWRFNGYAHDFTAIGDKGIFVDASKSPYDVVGIGIASGTEVWRKSTSGYFPSGRTVNYETPLLIRINYARDAMFFVTALGTSGSGGSKLLGMKVSDGSTVWQLPAVGDTNTIGFPLVNNVPLSGDQIWLPQGGTKLGIDLLTGKQKTKMTDIHHMNDECQYSFSTQNYIAFKGIYWANTQTNKQMANPYDTALGHGGGCGSQTIAANSLVYLGPKFCPCMTHGNSIRVGYPMKRSLEPGITDSGSTLLEVTTANSKAAAIDTSTGPTWPAYCANVRRTSATTMSLPENGLAVNWTRPVVTVLSSEWVNDCNSGDRLTSPVVAHGLVYVAEPDAHALTAFDAVRGSVRWRFVAGGRISSAPTIAEGRCVFGSHDGFLYCLDAGTGVLRWKNRLGRSPRMIVSHGQLESSWPVMGSVAVAKGHVAAIAGRYSTYGERIWYYGLNLQTGAVAWQQIRRGYQNYTRHINSVLATDTGEVVYQPRDWWMPGHLGLGVRQSIVTGKDMNSSGFTIPNCPTNFSIRRYQANYYNGGEVDVYDGKQGYLFWVEGNEALAVNADSLGSRVNRSQLPTRWRYKVQSPRVIDAMIAVGNSLLVAGHVNSAVDSAGGFIHQVSTTNGTLVKEYSLARPPVFQGLAAAYGRVYVSIRNGDLVCLADSREPPVSVAAQASAQNAAEISSAARAILKAAALGVQLGDRTEE